VENGTPDKGEDYASGCFKKLRKITIIPWKNMLMNTISIGDIITAIKKYRDEFID
jgi:hypothetical protein